MRIGLLWHSINSDNLGIGALTIAHIEIIEQVIKNLGSSVNFVVISWRDPSPFYLDKPNIEVVQLRMKNIAIPFRLVRIIRNCDIILDIAAGDSFTDIYGTARFLKMLAVQNAVFLSGLPLVLSPQTIGPFERPWIRRLAVHVLRRARGVATRDQLSTAYAREIGFTGDIVEAADVALRLPFHPRAETDYQDRVKVGINISGLLFNGGYTRDNMFGLKSDYRSIMRQAISYFLQKKSVEVYLVSHVVPTSNPVEDDHLACKTLAEQFPSVFVTEPFRDPISAKSFIASMDFFVGARMHACIAALSGGVPVLPMAYSRKFAGLFGTLGYDLIADCRAETQTQIMDKLDYAFAHRDQLGAKAAEALAEGLARLKVYEEQLFEYLVDTSTSRK